MPQVHPDKFRDEFWFGRGGPPNPPITEQLLVDAEQQLGKRLPCLLKQLLLRFNGGDPRRSVFAVEDPEHECGGWNLEVGVIERLCDIASNGWFASDESLPRNLVQFGCGRAGTELLCLNYRESGPAGTPSVIYLDVALARDRLVPLAPDFESFVNGLFSHWRQDCVALHTDIIDRQRLWQMLVALFALKPIKGPYSEFYGHHPKWKTLPWWPDGAREAVFHLTTNVHFGGFLQFPEHPQVQWLLWAEVRPVHREELARKLMELPFPVTNLFTVDPALWRFELQPE